MLNIEVIKFEAQDVITASAPTAPQTVAPEVIEPLARCTCNPGDEHSGWWYGRYWEHHGNCTWQGTHICEVE